MTTFEAELGAGADWHMARSWCFGFMASYDWMGTVLGLAGGASEHSGLHVTVGIGWLFGRGKR